MSPHSVSLKFQSAPPTTHCTAVVNPTKYTSLANFHGKMEKFSPLDYESAGIYTNDLLDGYMDYKAMWKQISSATHELKGGRATVEIACLTEETSDLAVVKPLLKD